ncbi:MAG: hypothetical protein HKN13_06900, partial [Rhodothermales bacterium]|nr:hypothetical protein [Rhodothermales bacterium]
MLPDWAPGIHPLIVHFPIAIIFLAVIVDLYSHVRKSDSATALASTLYAAAGVAAVVAFFSGRQAADLVNVTAAQITDLNDHADWGLRTAWLVGILGLARLAWLRLSNTLKESVTIRTSGFILTLLGFVALFFVWQTAERGAKLVYLHGLGTMGITADPMARFADAPTPAGGQPFVLEDGSWNWSAPTDLAGFVSAVDLLEGDSSAVEFGVVHRSDGTSWL